MIVLIVNKDIMYLIIWANALKILILYAYNINHLEMVLYVKNANPLILLTRIINVN